MENNQPLFSYGSTPASLFSTNKFNFHFNPDGFYNNKNSWLSDDGTVKIIWDVTLNAWKLSGDSLGTTQVINTNGTYPPINGNWTVLGSRYTVEANQGECVPINHLRAKVEFDNPGCICDGSISVTATGGVPPYSYSYNNGITYGYSPIMVDLCGGEHIVKIKDSENIVVTKTITLPEITPPIRYVIDMLVVSDVNIGVNTWEKTYAITVTPVLPIGVEITFNMNLGETFARSPYINSANSTFTPQVIKNTIPIIGVDVTQSGSNSSPVVGCQGNQEYFTKYNYTYSNLMIKLGDVYTIKTVRSYNMTCNNTPPGGLYEINGFGDELGPLSYGVSNSWGSCCFAKFAVLYPSYVTAPIVSGCNCCSVGRRKKQG